MSRVSVQDAPTAFPMRPNGGIRPGRRPPAPPAVSPVLRTGAAALRPPVRIRPPARSSAASRVSASTGGAVPSWAMSVKTRTPYHVCSGAPTRERGGEPLQPVRAHLETEPVRVGRRVEGAERGRPVSGQTRPHGQRVRVADEQREQTAGGEHPGQPRQQRIGLLDVHQHPVAQHHVEAARQEVHSGVPAVALDDLHAFPNALGLRGDGPRARPTPSSGPARARLSGVRRGPDAVPGCPGPCPRRAPEAADRPRSRAAICSSSCAPPAPAYHVTQTAQLAQPGVARPPEKESVLRAALPRLT